MNDSATTLRVVVIGSTQVGKTSLVQRYVRNSYEPQQKSTIGAVFHSCEKRINGRDFVMQIWDTAGQEKYKSLGPIFYRDACAAIAVFDLTNIDSLPDLKQWISDFKHHTTDASVIIVANKSDLEDKVAVPDEMIQSFVDEYNTIYFKTSAKEGTGVEYMFETVFQKMADTAIHTLGTDRREVEPTSKCGSCC